MSAARIIGAFVVVAISVAVIFRVNALRTLVTGV